ncbi:hypothetical protein PR003_g1728 [Phytophthora rubi]|uniref:Uncharacterized protein n=1 Tax=Phytophthora rubi TaxID=129364 RepID=A0A6A4G054_9STRA|nr:hypothetical protein PR003_g1728 [Phytophthora rubi]
MAEIGGYNAVRFTRSVFGPSARFYSFEFSPHLPFANISDVVIDPFSETYTKLKELGIDHVHVRRMSCSAVAVVVSVRTTTSAST